MTTDEQLHQKAARLHQRERMRFWARIYGSSFLDGNLSERCSDFADDAVVEFDKRFPPPLSESQSPIAPAQEKSKTEIVKDLAQAKGMLFRDISEPKVQAAVDTDRERRENLHCVISDLTDQCREANTELAALREKARLYDKLCSELGPLKKKAEFWDAVASGKIILDHYDGNGWRCWTFGGTATAYFKSATEAVQAAIEAGALGPPTSDAWALK